MKKCKDCKFYKKSWFTARCYNPLLAVVDLQRVFNLVEYKQYPVYCRVARKYEDMCGPSAVHFIEKDGPPDENERRN